MDQLFTVLSVVLLLGLAAALLVRTVAVERAAGPGAVAQPFLRPRLVRWLDRACTLITLLVLISGVLLVATDTVGWP